MVSVVLEMSGAGLAMLNNSIKYDKFTMFFDKLLKVI